MISFEDFLAEQLQDPEVKKEYDALEAEFSAKQAALDLATIAKQHHPLF